MGRKSLAPVRRAEILKHFYEVLVKEGIEGASIARIAKHMGVYPGHITHYFKNKEEMLIELVESLMKEYAEQLIPQWEKIQDPGKRIHKILDMVFSVDWAEFLNNRVFFACFYLSLSNRKIHSLINQAYERFFRILTDEIENCIKPGISDKVDTAAIADMMIVQMEGISIYNIILRDKQRIEAASRMAKEIVLDLLNIDIG